MPSLFDTILSKVAKPAKPAPQPSTATFAMPQGMPAQFASVFDLIRPPQQAQFDVRAAQGTNPKKYTPTAINMSGLPVASVFGLAGAPQLPQEVFTVTPASGTKPKNYRPAQISMNAPSLAGPGAMQQMLAMMGNNFGATPFAPFGQG